MQLSRFVTATKTCPSYNLIEKANDNVKKNYNTMNRFRKTSISTPWRSSFHPFLYSGVLIEVAFN